MIQQYPGYIKISKPSQILRRLAYFAAGFLIGALPQIIVYFNSTD